MSDVERIGHQERAARRHLGDLIATVRAFSAQIDALMVQPSTVERGKKVAALVNALNYVSDQALYNGLGFDFRKDWLTKKPNIKAIQKEARRMYRKGEHANDQG